MSSTAIDSTVPVAKSSPLQSGLALLRSVQCRIAQIGKIGRIRRDTSFLLRLDDRMLADIGLHRGEVEYAVHHGRRPSDSPSGADR